MTPGLTDAERAAGARLMARLDELAAFSRFVRAFRVGWGERLRPSRQSGQMPGAGWQIG